MIRTVVLSFLCVTGLLCPVAQGQPGSVVNRHPILVAIDESGGTALITDVAVDGGGNFTVVWDILEGDPYTETDGIWARRYAASGVALGPKFRVAARTAPSPRPESPSIAMTSAGNFVVVWIAAEGGPVPHQLKFRRYDAAGAPLGAAVTVDTGQHSPLGSFAPDVAMDSSGNFVFVWQAFDGSNDRISSFAQLVSGDGTPRGSPFRLNQATAAEFQTQPWVAMAPSGDFVTVWQQSLNGGALTIQAKRFAAHGTVQGTEFAVAPPGSGPGYPSDAGVAMDGSGNFVVSYERQKRGEFHLMSIGVFARRFSATGIPVGAEFLVSKGIKLINRGDIAVDMNSAGEFALAWESTDKPEAEIPWPHFRLYNAAGSAVVGETSLPFDGPGYTAGTSLAIDGQGNFTFVWAHDAGRIYAHQVAGPHDTREACSIYLATRVGTDVNDTITGTSGADVIQARNGTDWVDGAGGQDIICGGGSGDQLYGSGGNDELYGGMGDDVLDGGAGTDLCDGRKHDNADTAIDCEKVIGVP